MTTRTRTNYDALSDLAKICMSNCTIEIGVEHGSQPDTYRVNIGKFKSGDFDFDSAWLVVIGAESGARAAVA